MLITGITTTIMYTIVPAAGDRVRRKLLQPGGAAQPRDLVSGLLDVNFMKELNGGLVPSCADLFRETGKKKLIP